MPVDLKRIEELGDILWAREQLRLPVGQEEQALLPCVSPCVDLLDHVEHRACLDLLVQLLGEFVVLEHGGMMETGERAIFHYFLFECWRRRRVPQCIAFLMKGLRRLGPRIASVLQRHCTKKLCHDASISRTLS